MRLLALRVIIKVLPIGFLRHPPLDDTTERGDVQQQLDIPLSAGPVRVLFPGSADCLNIGDDFGTSPDFCVKVVIDVSITSMAKATISCNAGM